jgi:undecaprenyl-diphosphatase
MALLKAILYGILEGVTEWLPVSSTGHLILLSGFLRLDVSDAFFELFEVVIQLGAILAVAVLFWGKLNPVSRAKSERERRAAWVLWGKVLLAVLPSAFLGLLLDDYLDAHFYNAPVVAGALIIYGVIFLFLERKKRTAPRTDSADLISWRTALGIGCFQVLSLIPGTSRSGATILGGILLGLSRASAAEFSFFLGIPTMAGAGALKAVKFFLSGEVLSGREILILAVATLTAFLVSLAVIRFLLDFVRRHSFAAFGVYRILLGAAVLLTYFL